MDGEEASHASQGCRLEDLCSSRTKGSNERIGRLEHGARRQSLTKIVLNSIEDAVAVVGVVIGNRGGAVSDVKDSIAQAVQRAKVVDRIVLIDWAALAKKAHPASALVGLFGVHEHSVDIRNLHTHIHAEKH